MQGFEKYYRKTWPQRLDVLKQENKLSKKQVEQLKQNAVTPALGDTQIENFLTQFQLPEGLALNFVIDGKEYLIPMVIEEPSVVAGASHGAAIVKKAGGFQTKSSQRAMRGQVVLENVTDLAAAKKKIEEQETELLQAAADAHPSIVKRGGGPLALNVRILEQGLLSVDLIIDTKEAMGANMINSMLEAVADKLRTTGHYDVLMAILSNYTTECLVTASCQIPVANLAKNGLSGLKIAQKLAQASRVAQVDPYRAATHNKGIMNGIDAAVIASGNDWRAIEAAAHAYAARDGQYRGLSTWKVVGGQLEGELCLPVPVGSVGGSIGIVPLVQVNSALRSEKDALELEKIIASVGLAQNLAALYALVTEGIQKGHMNLQMKSLAVSVGAKEDEIQQVVSALQKLPQQDQAVAQHVLDEIRNEASENE